MIIQLLLQTEKTQTVNLDTREGVKVSEKEIWMKQMMGEGQRI